jgi:uncharacterized protein (DUF305 family)
MFIFKELMIMKLIVSAILICFSALLVFAQQSVIVQPGAPGQPTKILPANTTAKLPPLSAKDVEFMQGMIMHHAQAVEMTAMIELRTKNKGVRLIGAKISQSQADEINFMKRWLTRRGEKTEMPMPEMPEMKGMNHSHDTMLMPGMLSEKQMEALRTATGTEFDRLFLKGMIQHHEGALVMVKDLFKSAGAGQDAEIFNFASDIDTGQRGEIKIMQTMLVEKPKKEKK